MEATNPFAEPVAELIDTAEGQSTATVPETVGDLSASPQYYRIGPDGFTKVPVSHLEYKKYMREHFTVHHKAIPNCGHKLVLEKEPRHRNCESCWFAFFQVHGESTQSMDEVFSKFGEAGIRQIRGPKFSSNFLKFMSTVAQWKKMTGPPVASADKEIGNDDTQQNTSGLGSSDELTVETIEERRYHSRQEPRLGDSQ